MKLNRYIISVSLSVFLAVPAILACLGPDSSGYYSSPFNVTEPQNQQREGDGPGYDETLDFWHDYTKGNISREDTRRFFDYATIDSIGTRHYKFYDYLLKANDRDALEYIMNCLEFNRLVENYQGELWDYEVPSPDDIRNFISRIEHISTSTAFKPRYEFLKIRAYGAIKDNDGVMKIWKNNEKRKMSDALRTRMLGYVGGVLYRQGKYAEALDYFYRAGDNNSVQWCIEKLAGSDNLSRLYQHNPTSPAIPFIMEDYVNYLIATTEAGRNISGDSDYSVFDPDIREACGEAVYDAYAQRNQMSELCRRVLDENKTDCPMAWATVSGIVSIISGDAETGLNTLLKAKMLNGDNRTRGNLENFTLWALMLNSGKGNDNYDREFADVLKVRYNGICDHAGRFMRDYSPSAMRMRDSFGNVLGPDYQFMTEFFAREAVAHFCALGQPQRAMAILAMLDDMPAVEYGNRFLVELRNMIDGDKPSGAGMAFINYALERKPQNNIDRLLQPYAFKYLNLANDATGTRLMREGKFKEALSYLSQVDPKWARTQPVAPYLHLCYVSAEYYDFNKSEYINVDVLRSHINYKAIYCSNLIKALQEYDNLKGDEKALKALEIAGRFHFASPVGSGWAISSYRWSVNEPENEFTVYARKWLDNASRYASTVKTGTLISYALLALPSGATEYETSYPFGVAYSSHPESIHYYLDSPTDKQKEALKFIADNWTQVGLPWHVSRCDVLQSYVAGNFISKPRY